MRWPLPGRRRRFSRTFAVARPAIFLLKRSRDRNSYSGAVDAPALANTRRPPNKENPRIGLPKFLPNRRAGGKSYRGARPLVREELDLVRGEGRICGCQREVLNLCLRDEKPVERVRVVRRQVA